MEETAAGSEAMQDFLLLAVVAAAAVYGWFLMKRVDRFLEVCSQARALQDELQADCGKCKEDMV